MDDGRVDDVREVKTPGRLRWDDADTVPEAPSRLVAGPGTRLTTAVATHPVSIRYLGLRDLSVLHDPLEHGAEPLYDEPIGRAPAAFPDLCGQSDDLVIDLETRKVAVRRTARGTHRAAFLGQPATGRAVRFTGIEIVRFEGDRIVERWGEGTACTCWHSWVRLPEGTSLPPRCDGPDNSYLGLVALSVEPTAE